MDFLIELITDLFGWTGLSEAKKHFKEGNKKKPLVLTVLVVVLFVVFFAYMVYNAIQLFKAS